MEINWRTNLLSSHKQAANEASNQISAVTHDVPCSRPNATFYICYPPRNKLWSYNPHTVKPALSNPLDFGNYLERLAQILFSL